MDPASQSSPSAADNAIGIRTAENITLKVVVFVVATLVISSGIIVYTLSDRILDRFSAMETLTEDKDAAIRDAEVRARQEDRPRLTRDEKIQFVSIVNTHQEAEDEPGVSEGDLFVPRLIASCVPTTELTVINRPVEWSVSVLGGTGGYQYVWSGTDDLTGTEQVVTKTYATSGTKSASVTVVAKGVSNSPLTVRCSDVVRVQGVETF